jgi:predicted dehydrogenase
MGRLHARVMSRHDNLVLTAVAGRNEKKPADIEQLNLPYFASAEALIASETIDAVLIATPHFDHPEIAAAALERNLHVLCEKPLAVTARQAAEVAAVEQSSSAIIAMVLQYRGDAGLSRIREVLNSGSLGAPVRGEIVETFPRPPEYFEESWRGTWDGEGGGVLVNQAPHLLDRYLYLFGRPDRISAFRATRTHAIDVEDTASALCEHTDGFHGTVFVSTSVAPWTSSVRLICERGAIRLEDGVLTIDSVSGRQSYNVQQQSNETLLARLYDNFALAADGHEEPWVGARDALSSVEFANTILLASDTGVAQTMPPDYALVDKHFSEKLENLR